MGIMSFSGLRKAKTSAEFAREIAGLDEEIETVGQSIDRLEASKETAIFDGADGDLERVDAEIAATKTRLKNLEIAKAGAEKRGNEAAAREKDAELRTHVAAAEKDRRMAMVAYKRLSEIGPKMAELADVIKHADFAILQVNQHLRSQGRADLVVDTAYQVLNAAYYDRIERNKQGAIAEASEPARRGRTPAPTPALYQAVAPLDNPADPQRLAIPGFYPPRDHHPSFSDIIAEVKV